MKKPLIVCALIFSNSVWAADLSAYVKSVCKASSACRTAGMTYLSRYTVPCSSLQLQIYKIGLVQAMCTAYPATEGNDYSWADSRNHCYHKSGYFPVIMDVTPKNSQPVEHLDEVQANCGSTIIKRQEITFGNYPVADAVTMTKCYEKELQKKKDALTAQVDNITHLLNSAGDFTVQSPLLSCGNAAKDMRDSSASDKPSTSQPADTNANGGQGNTPAR